MASLKKKVIFRDRHKNHLALTLMTENVTDINLRKYKKYLLEKSELLKNIDDKIIHLIDKEDVYRLNSEVDSVSRQTGILMEI